MTDYDRKAKKLLMRHLTWRERCRFRRTHTLVFEGSNGLTYRLGEWAVSNVRVNGHTYCAMPWCRRVGKLPVHDVLLAQMLLIKTNAPEFHRIAHPRHGPHSPR